MIETSKLKTWHISGEVLEVNHAEKTITFWLSGFDETQTVTILDEFPQWLLHPKVAFTTTIPEEEARAGKLSGKHWGAFSWQDNSLTCEELTAKIIEAQQRKLDHWNKTHQSEEDPT